MVRTDKETKKWSELIERQPPQRQPRRQPRPTPCLLRVAGGGQQENGDSAEDEAGHANQMRPIRVREHQQPRAPHQTGGACQATKTEKPESLQQFNANLVRRPIALLSLVTFNKKKKTLPLYWLPV